MSPKKEYPLLIDSKITPSIDHKDTWCPMEQAINFIRNIQTSDVDDKGTADQYNALVSGVPTPWVRAKIFSYAVEYISNENPQAEDSGLISYFKMLVDEWKGLLAAFALFPDRFAFSAPISLDPDKATSGLSILSGLGTMLFEDIPYWKHSGDLKDKDPRIQLLYYQHKLLGATSPFTILFTGVDYKAIAPDCEDIPWFDVKQQKFTDPNESLKRNGDQLQKLYVFIKNIIKNQTGYIEELKSYFPEDRSKPDMIFVDRLIKLLNKWSEQLFELASRETGLILTPDGGVPPQYPQIQGPLAKLLKSEYKLYWIGGKFTALPGYEGAREIESFDDLFIKDSYIAGWAEGKNSMEQAPVHYLRVANAESHGPRAFYFALPLSELALELFNNNLVSMLNNGLGNNEELKILLKGEINSNKSNSLNVILTLEVDGAAINVNKEFEIKWLNSNRKIMIWPNFVSSKWDKYYLYSEYPSNELGTRFLPTYKTVFKDDKEVHPAEPYYLVKYPAGKVSSELHRYEIIRTNVPVERLKIIINEKGSDQLAGFLVVKDTVVKDRSTEIFKNRGAIIGFDFGSNNTCVTYATEDGGNAEPILYTNRRVALVGFDNDGARLAENDELLFFSNEGSHSKDGQVKSWLHEHDPQYTQAGTNEEIAAGVPVNEKNILVNDMNEEIIITQVGRLYHNMKWLSSNEGICKKTAFLRTLWIQICADLYDKSIKPEILRWSYPSSMSNSDRENYNSIFKSLTLDLPIHDEEIHVELKRMTESEAVCSYALTQDVSPENDQLFLGIDVGGSTSDILIIGKGVHDGNSVSKLFSQSSIRMAAGVFFNAVINSLSFRKSLYNFHESKKTKVHVENIAEITDSTNKAKGPYFLNSIFDQLQGEKEFYEFYSFLYRSVPFVFVLPAYVTGLLVTYSGMQVANVIKKQKLEDKIKYVYLQPYGKGGRLFDWLKNFDDETVLKFYSRCFALGAGTNDITLEYAKIRPDNKAEVSKGLVANHKIYQDEGNYEVWGEEGIKYMKEGEFITLNAHDNIESMLYENLDNFDFTGSGTKFRQFLNVLFDFLNNEIGVLNSTAELEEKIKMLRNVGSYIRNDKEYKKALDNTLKSKNNENKKDMTYKMPVIIAEGLYYLEQILIPELFKK